MRSKDAHKQLARTSLNGHKHRTETNGALTDSVCISDNIQEFASRNDGIAREIFATSKSRQLR